MVAEIKEGQSRDEFGRTIRPSGRWGSAEPQASVVPVPSDRANSDLERQLGEAARAAAAALAG